MKKLFKILIILIAAFQISSASADEDITGTWQGTLAPAPGSELDIQFIITKNDDGYYGVVLNSPDQGAIKNIKASSVTFDSGTLKLDVTDLSGSYEGVLKDGKFEGNWKQEGTSIPFNLKPYEKPVLTKEDKAKLSGQWYGEVKIPGAATYTLVFHFQMKEGSDFKATMDIPEAASKDIPVTEVELDEDTVKFKVPAIQSEFKGKLAQDELAGDFKLRAQPLPLTLKKGEYKAPTHNLTLHEDVQKQLAGEWHGILKMPKNRVHIGVRFEKTEKGDFVGYYGIPDQNIKGLPITEAGFNDGIINFKIKIANAEYKAQLAGDKLTGDWLQAGLSKIPFTMKKGEYIPPVYNLDLPDETKKALSGEWHGQLKTTTNLLHAALRFETNDKGDFLGFYDIPDQNQKGIQIYEAKLSDGKLTFNIPGGEYTAELSGDKLTGEVTQATNRNTLALKKGKYVPPVYSLELPEETRQLLSGVWHGQQKMKKGSFEALFRFETNDSGDFIGFYKVPDLYRYNPVTEASLKDGNLILKMQKGTNIEFKGKLAGDELTGEMIEQGTDNTPLSLKKGKYIPSVHSLDLTKETRDILSGEWVGKFTAGNNTYTVIFIFKTTDKGEFVGIQKNPDNGVNRFPIIDASYSGGKLSIVVPDAEFKGQLAGNKLTGEVIVDAGGAKFPFTSEKRKYVPAVYSLKLPKETMKALSGKWKGILDYSNVVFRFEKNKNGELMGFIDNSDNNQTGIPIKDASMSEGELTLEIQYAKIKGRLSKGCLECEWVQGARNIPLELKKE